MTRTVLLTLFTATASALFVILAHIEDKQPRQRFDWVETGKW